MPRAGDPRRRAGRGRRAASTWSELGCVAYAAAGQKWLCGADGTGMLYLDPEFGERVRTIAPTYFSFEDASTRPGQLAEGQREPLRPAAAARGRRALAGRAATCSRPRAWTRSTRRAADLADTFATKLAEAGFTVAPARPHDARRLRGRRPGGHARAAAGARRRRAQPARHAVPARVGRRLERRVRPRPAARGPEVKSVCVYCGSSFGADPAYLEATKQLAHRRWPSAASASSTAARPSV